MCPSSRWEIRDTIQSGKIEMIWTWGQKKTMTHLIGKYRHQIFVCSTRMTRNKKKSMASVKLIIMPQLTLHCSSSVSAAMSNTVRINIHYSWLSLLVSPSNGWRLFMRMLCVSLLTPDLRGWPSSQGVSGVNTSWCYESWSIITDFLPRIMTDLAWQKQPHFM